MMERFVMRYLPVVALAALLAGFTPAAAQDQTVGLFAYDTNSYEGYTFFAPMSSTTTYLIDNYGRTVHTWESDRRPAASAYLLENGNLLRTAYYTGSAGGGGGVQIIGWDAQERSITSWNFGEDGGHGRGWWVRDGDQWLIETKGVSPYGEEVAANNIITLLDDNTFRWQSTNRSFEGVQLEDTETVRVTRVRATD